MYFWRILKLREFLAKHSLSQKESVRYLIAFTVFYFLVIAFHSLLPDHTTPAWYVGYLALLFAVKIIGIYQCYRYNGGAMGSDFLSRYVAMAWVQLVRFFLFGWVALIAGMIIIEIPLRQYVLTTPHGLWTSGFLFVWMIAYYWRLCFHFRLVKTME